MSKRKAGTIKQKWNSLAWKPVDTSNSSMGDDDAVFLGLEEIDGNAFKLMKTGNGYEFNVNEESTSCEEVPEQQAKKKQKKSKKEVIPMESVEFVTSDDVDAADAATEGDTEGDSGKEKTKKKKLKKAKGSEKVSPAVVEEAVVVSNKQSSWGSVKLHHLLVKALGELNYTSPTAIQTQAIPVAISGRSDVVGAAETGSGKTLAFILPVMHSLLTEYDSWHDEDYVRNHKRSIYCLIIAPTRELALQITGVATDFPKYFFDSAAPVEQEQESSGDAEADAIMNVLASVKSKGKGLPANALGRSGHKGMKSGQGAVSTLATRKKNHRPIGVVSVTGGLSEHKQKRQLFNGLYSNNPAQFVHVLIATPGRLCELLTESNSINANLATGKPNAAGFLGNSDIDVARIVAEGTQHEMGHEMLLLARQHWRRLRYLVVDEADRLIEEGHFPELHRILDYTQHTYDSSPGVEVSAGADVAVRQSMLFSATCIANGYGAGMAANSETAKSILKWKKQAKQRKIQVVDTTGKIGKVGSLSTHIQNLLQLTALKQQVSLVDCTALAASLLPTAGAAGSVPELPAPSSALMQAMPARLLQFECHTPKEDKDLKLVELLLQNPGRTLVFVNSIKSARRVDGLLNALGMNGGASAVRLIHSQMQQRQRLKSLENFIASKRGCLIATDVAARGLDLPNVEFVIHYDIARSPQIYVHRSGRTARGASGATGTTISIVSPSDDKFYRDICSAMQGKTISVYPVNSAKVTYDISLLSEAVKLAREIFMSQFIALHDAKSKNWLETLSSEMDIG